MFINRGIFFNEKIAARHIGFGLIIVVVRNEVLDRVIRKEFPHFGIKLRGQRLIGRHDERGHALPCDDIGHRKGFARTGHAQERLKSQTALKPLV